MRNEPDVARRHRDIARFAAAYPARSALGSLRNASMRCLRALSAPSLGSLPGFALGMALKKALELSVDRSAHAAKDSRRARDISGCA